MFIGHYAPAFAAATSRNSPRLGPLFIAAQLVDLAFFAFVLIGVEHMRMVPGMTVMNPMDLYDMRWTHSLLATLGWAVGFAIALRLIQRNWTGSVIGAAVVVSHWLLDLLVHHPDLTIAGAPPRLGLGLWDHPFVEMPLELGITFVGIVFFVSRTRPLGFQGRIAPVLLTIALIVVQLVNWLTPQPAMTVDPVPASGPLAALAAYAVLTALAWWTGLVRVRT